MSDYFDRIEAQLSSAVARRAERAGGRRRQSVGALRARWRQRRTALAAGGLASAGAVVALALTLTAGSSTPAFAVVVHHDGSVTLTVNELIGVGPANARLAELGVRARLARREPSCTTKARPIPWLPADTPGTISRRTGHETRHARESRLLSSELARARAELRLIATLVHPGHGPKGISMTIRANAIPAGDTLLLVFRRVGGDRTRGGKTVEAIGGSIGLYRSPAPTCLPAM